MNSPSILDSSPAQVLVTGWRVGAQTVSAIEVIRTASQLGLAEAKQLVERVLSGAAVVVKVDSIGVAQELFTTLDRLSFDADVFN